MAIKGKTVVQAVIIGMLLLIIWNLWSRPSGFTLAPTDIGIRGTGASPSAMFDMTPSLACVPGPSAQADYYTSGLTPGGLCGGMNYVHSQQRNYSIMDGIGGPLMGK